MAGPRRDQKLAVWQRDGFQCVYCRKVVDIPSPDISQSIWATVDHVIPRSKGGSNDKKNLVTACFPCNLRKGDGSGGRSRRWHRIHGANVPQRNPISEVER